MTPERGTRRLTTMWTGRETRPRRAARVIPFAALCLSLVSCRDPQKGSPFETAPPVPTLQSATGSAPAALAPFPPVPGWQREEPRPLGHEEGFSQGYNTQLSSGNIAVTIYVYRRGVSGIPDGPSSDLVERQIEDALSAVHELVRLGEAYRSVKVLARDTVSIGEAPDAPMVRRLVLRLENLDGPQTISTILLTGAKGHFVKFRITQSGLDSDGETKTLRPLLNALGKALL